MYKPRLDSQKEEIKIVSLNVGLPREVIWHGIKVMTGIFKQPVQGRVALRKLSLAGATGRLISRFTAEHTRPSIVIR